MKQDEFGGCEIRKDDVSEGWANLELFDWSSMTSVELRWADPNAIRADAARLLYMAAKLEEERNSR